MAFIKNKLFAIIIGVLLIAWAFLPHNVEAASIRYEKDFASNLKVWDWVLNPEKFGVKSDKTLRQNVIALFYPNTTTDGNAIYNVIKDITLWAMILFIIWSWAQILRSWKKAEESKKYLYSLLYIWLGWVFIYAANRLFGSVLKFNSDELTADGGGIWGATNAFIWKNWAFFIVLSWIKAIAFFTAIIMIAVTWFRVIAAWEWEKWKKLVKWLINIVFALIIIKWVDFVYYLAADSWTFIKNASDFIINIARVFGYIYGVLTVIMVIIAWYLYITDWWTGNNFKRASNILVNILLSWLVLFSFLLILYQVFAEFQTGWDAVTEEVTMYLKNLV